MKTYRVDIFTESGLHPFWIEGATSWFENSDGIVFVNGEDVISTLKVSDKHTIAITAGKIVHEYER